MYGKEILDVLRRFRRANAHQRRQTKSLLPGERTLRLLVEAAPSKKSPKSAPEPSAPSSL